MADFKRWKEQRLSRGDASRKGSVDEPIEEIVRLLNGRETFCTTSSCSGRVVVLEQPPAAAATAGTAGFEIQKQSCTWLMVTHQLCSTKDVLTALQKAAADAIFKFEPFVLHVQCQDLEDAQLLARGSVATETEDDKQKKKGVEASTSKSMPKKKRFFVEPMAWKEEIPTPKLFMDVIQKQWAKPDTFPTPGEGGGMTGVSTI
ncbi:tRNA wybutosine-synthesizing protein 3 homolog isoform X3 [Thamnophis elegans]|uniref:tRNA wybutosine-synthesizing protein 3 homolog isoform X3 n=1 Tax=Thamnophis elegans TaxID=35005 RepID=UPI0013766C9B|nr:tRNA wybutosine-synthesizing protein 3 homolog isoform X3 [Thamnophis elegans]